MKPRLAAHLFIVLVVLNEVRVARTPRAQSILNNSKICMCAHQLLFVFLTLGNLFIFLGDDHGFPAEAVYILRMLWTSVGCATPLAFSLYLSLSLSVCARDTRAARLWPQCGGGCGTEVELMVVMVVVVLTLRACV
jgi:hypothetical protein